MSCLDLPGCHSQGESRDEALEHIREAIALWPQPSVQDWLVLHERGVIDGAELRQQLGLGEPHGGSCS